MTRIDFNFWLIVILMVLDVFALVGIGLIVRVVGPVRRLTRASHVIERLTLDVALGPNEPIGAISSRPLYDLLLPGRRGDAVCQPYLRFPIGRLVLVAHTNVLIARRVAREVQVYAFFVAVLFVVGIVIRAQGLEPISFETIRNDIGTHPFHAVDLLAVVALFFLAFRLLVELRRLGEMLVPPD